MKATLFITSIFCLQLSAKGLSQDKFTIHVKHAKVSSVLSILQKKSDYRFFYNVGLLDKHEKIDLEVTDATLTDILGQILDSSLSYKILNARVVVIADPKTLKQQLTVRGMVTDETNLPLSGVSIRVKGGNKGTSTDVQGDFVIQAGENDSLEVSYLGYERQVIGVAGRTNINIILKATASALDEVVIVGYGSQKRSTVSGAVAEVQLDKLESRSLNSVGDVLQGKSPGVTVTNEGGDPTAAPRVNIRGMGGINGEAPLYVIDGSIFSGTPSINPNDIESISVLKDASAAIYGARASGGVVLITTKKGKTGEIGVTVDAKLGAQSPWRKLQPLNAADRATISNLAADNAGLARNPAFDATAYPDGHVTRANWVDEIFRTGTTQDYNIALDGGNEKSSFFTSFNYRNAESILLNTYSKRYNFRANSQHQITSWLRVGENVSYSHTNGTGANTSSGYTGAILSALFYPSNVAPYTASGAFSGLPEAYGPGTYGDLLNPVAYLRRLDIQQPTNTLQINPYAEVKLMPGLSFRSNFSYTTSATDYKAFTTRVPEIGRPSDMNSLTQEQIRVKDLLAEQTLSYDRTFGKHHLDLVAGYIYQSTRNDGFSVTGQGFDDESPAYRYLVNANELLPATSLVTESALVSYLARINYDYEGRYILSLIGRRDGSSLVSSDNRFQNYGSISVGWLLKKERFLESVDWLSNLKLRASYGILGNLASLSPTAVSPLLTRSNVYFGQSAVLTNGYAETILANPDLTWAQSKQTNIGLDIGVLNDRLTFVGDYFVKKTSNMIMDITLPGTTGMNTSTVNGGLVKDSGIELGLKYQNASGGAFQYDVSAVFGKLMNNVESLAGGLNNILVSESYRATLQPVVIQPGQALYSYYVLQTDGLFQSQEEIDNYRNSAGNLIQPNAVPGDFRFVDNNGDGSINNNDRVFMGSAYPDFTYGISFNANYKNFDLNIFGQGVQGNELFNATKFNLLNAASGQPYNMLDEIKQAWTPENPNATIPRVSLSDRNGNFSNASDFYIEKGSYFRLRSITLCYTLPEKLFGRTGINRLRVYGTANNLFTITDYSGFDPEIGMDQYGLDAGRYPQARTILLGLSVKF